MLTSRRSPAGIRGMVLATADSGFSISHSENALILLDDLALFRRFRATNAFRRSCMEPTARNAHSGFVFALS